MTLQRIKEVISGVKSDTDSSRNSAEHSSLCTEHWAGCW